MEYRIQTLNAISPIIYTELKDQYRVSDSVENPDAILVRSASMHDMQIPKSVECIARAGAGTNNIPISACSEAGICVFNTPGANANAVAELVIAGLLLSCRDIIGGVAWEKTQKGLGDGLEAAVEKGKKAFVGPELRGKTLGVIGLGAIGVLVANAAIALGMNVIGYDPMISVDHAWRLSRSVRHETSLDALFTESDFLTVHVPLNDKTRGMIGSRALSLCKKGIRIMNFARGGLVDENALIAALGDGTVSSYVTDFGSDRLLADPWRHLPAAPGRLHAGERGELRRYGCRADPGLSGKRNRTQQRKPSQCGSCAAHQAAPGLHPRERAEPALLHHHGHFRLPHQYFRSGQPLPRQLRGLRAGSGHPAGYGYRGASH